MKKLIVATLFTLLFTSPVFAGNGQYGQYGQYGGGASSYSVIVDKMVSNGVQTKGGQISYVDNYSPADPRMQPGQQAFFQVKVKNTSNEVVYDVQVMDIMPEYLEPIEGPGSYDASSRSIKWSYDQLKAGEERTEQIVAQIYPQDKLPADKGVMCLSNKSTVQLDGAYDEDTAQFCLEKEVIGVKQVPTAGPELGLAFGALQIAGLGLGFMIKSRS